MCALGRHGARPVHAVGQDRAPDARLDDGKFEVRVFRGFSKPELLRHLAAIAFGRYRYAPHVSTYRAEKVLITSRHPLRSRADSHDLGTTPLEIAIRPRALCVMAPRPSPN